MKVYLVEKINRIDYVTIPIILGVYSSYELAKWYCDESYPINWRENFKGTGYSCDGEWLFLIKEFPLITNK